MYRYVQMNIYSLLDGCACAGAGAGAGAGTGAITGAVTGAATGGFIGGVLLTAAIAGVIALVVLCRAKRRGTTKLELVLSTVTCTYT